jgi:tetratricopeptide (TPR) repeat protein
MACSSSPRSIHDKYFSSAVYIIVVISIGLLPFQIGDREDLEGISGFIESLKSLKNPVNPVYFHLFQGDGEVRQIEPGKPIERELSGDQLHLYQIRMTAGQYLHIEVDQRGSDVVVVFHPPDGGKKVAVDNPYGAVGLETVMAIAESSGIYKIEVRAFENTVESGRYEIKLEELREATADDRHRIAAGSLFLEARQLSDGTLEDRRKSLEKYHEALGVYRRLGYHRRVGETLNNIGLIYDTLGEFQTALKTFNEALPIRQAAGDRMGEGHTLNNIGLIYSRFGKIQEPLEKYNEALPISRAGGDRTAVADILNNMGVAYQSIGEPQKALAMYNEVLPIRRRVGDRRGEAVTLNNMGAIYRSMGEMRKALENYNESLSIARATGDRKEEALTLNNIGVIHHSTGEVQEALEKYNEALRIERDIGARMEVARTLINIGSVYSTLGEMQKALDISKEVLPILVAIGDRRGEAITLANTGSIYRSMGEMQNALSKYNEALSISRAIGNREVETRTLNNIGHSYYSLGEIQRALEKYNEALLLSRAAGDRKGEAYILHDIGLAYNSLGDVQKAQENYNAALAISRAAGERRIEAGILLDTARVEQKRGNLSQARKSIEHAISMIESMRINIASQELRASFFASQQEFYQTYIDLLMEMHRQNPAAAFDAAALAVSERARARSLLELLSEARAELHRGVNSSLLERKRSLQQMLTAKATAQVNLFTRDHTPEQAGTIAKEIASITAEYEELEARIRQSNSRYDALTRPLPLNLSEIQQQVLDPETLLLEYSLGDQASHLFVVSHNSITSYRLPKRTEIEEATRHVREMLTAPQPRAGDTAAKRQTRIAEAKASYWPQAAALSRMLLGPAAQQLGAKRLLIVADGALQYLPFSVLPVPERRGDGGTGRVPFRWKGLGLGDENSSPRRPASPTPLIVEHEIVHLPSASTLAVLRRELAGRKPAPKTVAVLADPVFSAGDARVKLAASDHKVLASNRAPEELTRSLSDVRGQLARLLMTRDEAQAILSLTHPNSRLEALDFRASRATGTSDELSQYRIVHFATHGLLNSQHPQLSGLVLSLVDERGQPQDGFLQLHEIFNLRLPAELVVLSACQTGLGKEIKGEGLVGLTRGFMYAGAARVAASLWQVDDAATAELMKRFYRGMLQEGKRPAAALRAAQVEMWRRPQWQSPYYWGAFVLQGEWK